MTDIKIEIARVQNAIKKTTSENLKRDYMKHLKRLYKKKRCEMSG